MADETDPSQLFPHDSVHRGGSKTLTRAPTSVSRQTVYSGEAGASSTVVLGVAMRFSSHAHPSKVLP
jgi:hypothetical protein